jgi:hypothetical protein
VSRRDPNASVYKQIRKILHADWDPIGCGVPEDEYDFYVPKACALLKSGAGAEMIADYLDRVCEQRISLPPVRERSLAAGKKIAALKEQLV